MHHTGIAASHHRWRSFSFLLLKWIRPDFKTPHFHCHFVSQSLWERFSHWQPLLERWWLEVVWSLPLSSSTVDPGVIQRQGNTQCSMGTLCFLGSFGNICNCKQLSCHTLSLQVSCFAMKLSLRLVQCFMAPGNFWDGCSVKCKMSNLLQQKLRVQRRAAISTETWMPSSKTSQRLGSLLSK